MTKKEMLQYIATHEAGKVKIAYTDIDGILRGKYISTNKMMGIVEKGATFCDVIFGWDAGDAAYENCQYTGWHTGYPDAPTKIDLSTFRKIPWENGLPFYLGEIIDAKEAPAHVCPRQLLKKVKADAKEMGYSVNASQEFEWYNFLETPQSAAEKGFRGLTPLTPGMFGYSILRSSLNNNFFDALFSELKKFDIPLEGIHTETGPGTYEAAIEYSDMLTAADRATLFKTAVKEIAYKHGIIATFMAKIDESLPGCGGHVHQSLWDKGGKKNMFFDAKDNQNMSSVFKQYVAGQLYCLPLILPLFAPTINSYKRLVEGAWAPTTLTWGIDNRTVALRVLQQGAAACRLETRVIGADVNPYLAIAASIASGLYGIRHQLKLKQPSQTGNGYLENKYGVLPRTLEQANAAMKSSPVARELFGEKFTAHFTATRDWEWKQHLKSVTDWELKRYLEII